MRFLCASARKDSKTAPRGRHYRKEISMHKPTSLVGVGQHHAKLTLLVGLCKKDIWKHSYLFLTYSFHAGFPVPADLAVFLSALPTYEMSLSCACVRKSSRLSASVNCLSYTKRSPWERRGCHLGGSLRGIFESQYFPSQHPSNVT